MASIEETLEKLNKSTFRASFRLTEKDKEYYKTKGETVIRQHAYDFVKNKLAPAQPINDGKQTPTHGHPVFKAQHATATCCRGCLNKWYKVPKGVELSSVQQEKIVNLIMAWINNQLKD